MQHVGRVLRARRHTVGGAFPPPLLLGGPRLARELDARFWARTHRPVAAAAGRQLRGRWGWTVHDRSHDGGERRLLGRVHFQRYRRRRGAHWLGIRVPVLVLRWRGRRLRALQRRGRICCPGGAHYNHGSDTADSRGDFDVCGHIGASADAECCSQASGGRLELRSGLRPICVRVHVSGRGQQGDRGIGGRDCWHRCNHCGLGERHSVRHRCHRADGRRRRRAPRRGGRLHVRARRPGPRPAR
mmetsp:Transcript_64082/g.196015  ORF Transcript_64082/g.196015 Transcript_64082/m.196015 type:complete len:243 (-) Transcript_64082:5071-5799(-)